MISRLERIFFQLFQIPANSFNEAIGPAQVRKWDSLGHMQLITALEKEFRIKFSVTEIMQIVNVKNIILVLQKHGILE